MKKYLGWPALGLVVAVCLSSCGSAPPDDPDPGEVPSRLGDAIDLSLADLLTKPRAELAEMADDVLNKVRLQHKAHRDSNEVFLLLPQLRVPLAVPVLREAHHSASAGFSLPPYVAEGAADSELALQLARYGDVEAARRLVDPADADAAREIEQLAGARNYPVEWTRLTALLLHSAQLRLATGDLDGGTVLVQLHRQLQQVLDNRAAQGPLGAVLLSPGRRTLTLAAAAWKASSQPVLVQQSRDALAAWGDAPRSSIAIPLGTSRSQVARLLRSDSQGRVLPARDTLRALDLYGLPLPDEGADAVLSFFDKADRLSEVLVLYKERMSDSFPGMEDLALLFREQLHQAGDAVPPAGVHGLQTLTCRAGEVTCDVALVPRNRAVGAFVRLHGDRPSDAEPTLARDFGDVHLDRSFEQNRLRLAPEQRGETIQTDRPATVAHITNPLAALHPAQVVLQREASEDVVARLLVHYGAEQTLPALAQQALPLWAAYGPARIEGNDDERGGHVGLQWEDGQTRWTLRLPYASDAAPELEVADREPAEALPQRVARATDLDRAERKARLAAGKPWRRLPRSTDPDTIQLGMSRDAVVQALPSGKAVLTGTFASGLLVTNAGDPARGAAYALRQLLLRFSDAGQLAEIRARYQGTVQYDANKGLKDMLARFKKRGGAPAEVPSPSAGVWEDIAPGKPGPVLYRWLDDTTLLTFRWETSGAEVTLRDCPPDQEAGAALPPLEYLPRGPEGCTLGDTRAQLLRRWGITEPTTAAGGALVLTPPQPAPYDAVLVWFDNDRVIRIVGRHTPPASPPVRPPQLADALSAAWGRDIRSLGWPVRQDLSSGDALQSLGWHDERTRVRLFWQEPDQGPPRVYTEWKELR
jgi:hypothetical protein